MFDLLLILVIGLGCNQRTGRSVHFGENGLHVKAVRKEHINKLRKKQDVSRRALYWITEYTNSNANNINKPGHIQSVAKVPWLLEATGSKSSGKSLVWRSEYWYWSC